MDKKRIFKDYFIYSAGNYISQAVGILSGFLLRVFLEPYYMGIWQGLSIITTYTSYTNLGISKSAAREIPYFISKNNNEKAESLKNIGFTFSLVTIIPVGLCCIGIAFSQRSSFNLYLFWGFIAIGLVVILERLESYIITILRSKKKFAAEAVNKVFGSLINLALVVILVRHFKLFGLYGVDTIVLVCSIIVLLILSKERFRIILKKDELRHLLKIGIPLVLLGFMSVNVTNVDRIVILKMLGAERLGLYSIAIMMGTMVYTVSNMASIILYPRFQELYGKNDDKDEVHAMMIKIIRFLWLPLLILISGCVIFLPYLVRQFIPKYNEGITAMQFFLGGIYFFSLSAFCSNFLVTINKQVYCLFICAATMLINLILSIASVKLGFGIEGVALSASVSYFFHFAVLFSTASIMAKK